MRIYKKRKPGPLHPAVEALRDRRKAAGISQRELADISVLGQSSVSEMELGKISPNLITLQTYAEALGGTVVIHFYSATEGAR